MEGNDNPIVLPEFKYYHGEKENPFPERDSRSNFWWGEMMFSQLPNLEEQFKKYEKDVEEWRKWLLEQKPNQSAHLLNTNTNRQLRIAYYIVILFGKWNLYDDQEWIVEY